MKLSSKKREEVRLLFGGKCAYCGIVLDGKWHVDHMLPVGRETEFIGGVTKDGFSRTRATGKMQNPQNDVLGNMVPACVKCNILKSNATPEEFRSMLTYFSNSIPEISTYTHVHHLMRFGKLHIDTTPVVFWFEEYRVQNP